MTEQSREHLRRTIYCCSGASNVGVLSFMAAIRLAQEGYGSFACIAGIGSKNQPMIRAATMAGERILIDGCPVACGKKILEEYRIPVDTYVVVTELGIEKTHSLDVEDGDIGTVVTAVRKG